MTSQSDIFLFSLTVLLTVACLFLFFSGVSSGKLNIISVHSNGQTVKENGNVIIPNQKLTPGSVYRVLGSLFQAMSESGKIQFTYENNSRFKYSGYPKSRKSLHLLHMKGQGKAKVNDSQLLHSWNHSIPRLIQKSGKVAWNLEDTEVLLRIGTNFSGHWKFQGDLSSINMKRLNSSLTIVQDSVSIDVNDTLKLDFEGGSMISGKKLSEKINSHSDEEIYETPLREIFGFWPRDRWGNIYLYSRNTEGNLSIRSAGPDERFLTSDDVHLE